MFVMDRDFVLEILALHVGNHSILYMENDGTNTINKCVGLPKQVKEKNISHEDYRRFLANGEEKVVEFTSCENKWGTIKLVCKKRTALGAANNLTRYFVNDKKSYPYGHYKLEQILNK